MDPCLLATEPAHPLDTLTVVLADSVAASHAGRPSNDTERLLFRQLYPGLIRLNCNGEVRPDLAAGWSVDSTGRGWTFELRDGARLADGSALTAAILLASWRARWPEVRDVGVDSVTALDQRRLFVTLRDIPDASLQLFAEPVLSAIPPNHRLDLTGRLIVPRAGGGVLEFITSTRGDLRDELDAGADLVVTREPAVIDYAAQRPELQSFPLPWDRIYVLSQHHGAMPLQGDLMSESARRSLAEEAVRADARPSQRPFWGDSPCSTEISKQVTIPTAPRVVYLNEDPVARQLAERIVALAADSSRLAAQGLDAVGFAASRREGMDRAYIVSVPLRTISPCREAARLTGEGWITPLVDTRARAIVRRGSPALTVDWDGVVRLP